MPEAHAYTVTGRWPFPTDMLRRDGSEPASPKDRALVERLSGPVAPEPEGLETFVVDLVIQDAGRAVPNAARWASFDWSVVGSEIPAYDAAGVMARRRREALAKLTSEEIEALRWFGLDAPH